MIGRMLTTARKELLHIVKAEVVECCNEFGL
jgi:hypothetical protein